MSGSHRNCERQSCPYHGCPESLAHPCKTRPPVSWKNVHKHTHSDDIGYALGLMASLCSSIENIISLSLSLFLSLCPSLFLSVPLSFFLSVPLSFFLCACLSLSLSLSAWHITQGKEGAARHRMTGAIGECHVCDRRQLADMNLVQVKLGENFALKPCPTQDTDRCVPQFAFWNLRGTR